MLAEDGTMPGIEQDQIGELDEEDPEAKDQFDAVKK